MSWTKVVFVFLFVIVQIKGFLAPGGRPRVNVLALGDKTSGDVREVYRNPVAQAFSTFIIKPSDVSSSGVVDLDSIDWSCRKRKKTSLRRLSDDLCRALKQREWFVTGNVDPKFFSNDFYFQDPDVATAGGVEVYARGVAKIFSPGTRAEVIKSEVDDGANTLTVTWRIEGRVSIGPRGLPIKPFLVFSDLTVDENGLITSQQDRFSIPGWDIFLSAIFPFTIGKLTAPPALPASQLSDLEG